MTQNQINFARLQEEKRHNLATEGYTGIELAETQRHNQSSEGINWYNAQEQRRHDVASEDINWFTAETGRTVGTAQAANYYAQAYKNQQEGKFVAEKYAQEREKIEQAWQKLVNDYDIAIRNVSTKEDELAIAEDKTNAYIDDLMLRLNFDQFKYMDSERKRALASALRDALAAGESATRITDKIFNWLGLN